MVEMKVFVINLDEQEKDTGCAWFTLPCNIEALKQKAIQLHQDDGAVCSASQSDLCRKSREPA